MCSIQINRGSLKTPSYLHGSLPSSPSLASSPSTFPSPIAALPPILAPLPWHTLVSTGVDSWPWEACWGLTGPMPCGLMEKTLENNSKTSFIVVKKEWPAKRAKCWCIFLWHCGQGELLLIFLINPGIRVEAWLGKWIVFSPERAEQKVIFLASVEVL